MTRVFVYEFITAGGLYAMPGAPEPSGSLLEEGTLMRSAVVDDFLKAGVSVSLFRDHRLPAFEHVGCDETVIDSSEAEKAAFATACNEANAVLVIAPEFGALLLERVLWAEAGRARLISPGSDFTAIAGDKWNTYRRWTRAGVPTPDTWLEGRFSSASVDKSRRFVRKPRDGAGSQEIDFYESPEKFGGSSEAIIQTFCEGLHASCALLGDGKRIICLPPGTQKIDPGNGFQYRGGCWPLAGDLAERAQTLARRAATALPPFRGYIGVDMILGAKDGDDFAIEINPRLTTSYFGLRHLCRGNLSAAMLAFASGDAIRLEFSGEEYELDL
ncbi:ATP-grasp domain-containing protein [Blastopirellula sp. JC732]|uniref:ATP-grasp domain-containing protein n=1 Tax=Blastopirellula sediminis TaxID=2894196 RepID=A0A9X1MTC1_9BACT|nr:ATP-grasp domain-containing protein [Blastopirellula sediminis]MCC9604472.1 ATP-grasp domain-containing protein [Blastopirellula sediminis]MCC9632229.1 ATP-grasp domain-containing protein [Blastopirellula sediminis]